MVKKNPQLKGKSFAELSNAENQAYCLELLKLHLVEEFKSFSELSGKPEEKPWYTGIFMCHLIPEPEQIVSLWKSLPNIEYDGKQNEICAEALKILRALRNINGPESLQENKLYFPKEV